MSAVSALPTRLRLADLLHTTDLFADKALAGQYDHLLPPSGLPADKRWSARLHGDDALDVWLISWAPQRCTELHDHGRSLGAVTVLSGSLHETRWDGKELRKRTLVAGDQAGFPLGLVHDVEWAPDETGPGAPTLSVHAYSPPLTTMSHYEVTEHAILRPRNATPTAPEG